MRTWRAFPNPPPEEAPDGGLAIPHGQKIFNSEKVSRRSIRICNKKYDFPFKKKKKKNKLTLK